ncbi:hypothetical protein VOLCADRAFT_116088, partial [Volvox carteri f. nagariensis]
LDDLRRTGVIGSRDIQSSLAYPGLSPNFLNEPLDPGSDDERDEYDDGGSDGRSASSGGAGKGGRGGRNQPRSMSPDQGPGRMDPLRYSATASARAVLLHEKPSVVERMEKGVAACAVLRDNRRFRLFSLGSISGGGGGGGSSSHRGLLNLPSMSRTGSLGRQQQQQQPTQQSPSQQLPPPPGSPNGNCGASGANTQRTTQSADYWMRVTLPPEVIEAQLRHLAAATEANLRTYHDRVAAAQDDLLRTNGLSTEALGVASEVVEQSLKIKLGQIKEDTTVNNFNYSALSREAVLATQLGPASVQLLTATTLPQFIRAALDHVRQHSGELSQLKSSLQQPEDGRRRSTHRRARAKSTVASLNLPAGALAGPGIGGGGRMDGGDSARTLTSEPTNTTASATTANGDDATTDPDGAEPEGSAGSGIWPSYVSVKHRATSAGGQLSAAADPTAASAGGPAGSSASASASVSGAAATRVTEDAEAAHLEHLRRHASPDSAAREPRWSPPAPVLAGNLRGRTAAPPLGSGGPGGGGGGGPSRRAGTFIDEEWMSKFRSELLAVESNTPDQPPEGLLPLPPLPPINMDAGTYVRCRLERLWSLLDVPPPQQLDIVLTFTGRDRALQFARNLEMWEQAAVAVLGREAQVEALVAAQREIEAGRADMLSLATVSTACIRVLQQTRWVEELSGRLRAGCGWALSYHGKPYPGSDAITSTHLLAFMEQLRQVTQITGLRP